MISFFLIVCSCLGILVGNFLDEGIPALRVFGVSSLLLNLGIFILINRIEKRYLLYKCFAFFFVVQPIPFSILVWLYPLPMSDWLSRSMLLDETPYTLLYSFCLIPLLCLVCAVILSMVSPVGSRPRGFDFYLRVGEGRMGFHLVFAAIVVNSIWLATAFGGPISYLFRVLHKAFAMVPMLAGMLFRKSRIAAYAWGLGLAFSFILAFFTGSRGYFFYPATYFMAGIYFAFETQKNRFRYLLFLATLIPIALVAVGFIGNLRSEFGRTQITDVNVSEILRNIEVVVEKSFASENSFGRESNSAVFRGLSRIMDQTVVLAPSMSPRISAYRGYSDILRELRSMLVITGTDRTQAKVYGSRLYASLYGYNTHYSVTYQGNIKSFTVPFNIFADSWSRFGLVSVVVQVGFALVFMTLAERLNIKLWRKFPDVMVMGFFITLGIVFTKLTVYTLSESVRQWVLLYGFSVSLMLCVHFIRIRLFPNSMRRHMG